MATLSNILAWRIPRTEKPSGLQSMGMQRVGHNWSDLAGIYTLEPRPSDTCSHWLRLRQLPSLGQATFQPSGFLDIGNLFIPRNSTGIPVKRIQCWIKLTWNCTLVVLRLPHWGTHTCSTLFNSQGWSSSNFPHFSLNGNCKVFNCYIYFSSAPFTRPENTGQPLRKLQETHTACP